jgi:hypothetical protein
MKKNTKLNILIYLLPGLKQVRQQQGSELPGHPGIKKKQIAKINICSFLFAVVKRKKSVHVLLSSQSLFERGERTSNHTSSKIPFHHFIKSLITTSKIQFNHFINSQSLQ